MGEGVGLYMIKEGGDGLLDQQVQLWWGLYNQGQQAGLIGGVVERDGTHMLREHLTGRLGGGGGRRYTNTLCWTHNNLYVSNLCVSCIKPVCIRYQTCLCVYHVLSNLCVSCITPVSNMYQTCMYQVSNLCVSCITNKGTETRSNITLD